MDNISSRRKFNQTTLETKKAYTGCQRLLSSFGLLSGRVGSGRVGSGRVGSGRVGKITFGAFTFCRPSETELVGGIARTEIVDHVFASQTSFIKLFHRSVHRLPLAT